jgi:hypothetical protein
VVVFVPTGSSTPQRADAVIAVMGPSMQPQGVQGAWPRLGSNSLLGPKYNLAAKAASLRLEFLLLCVPSLAAHAQPLLEQRHWFIKLLLRSCSAWPCHANPWCLVAPRRRRVSALGGPQAAAAVATEHERRQGLLPQSCCALAQVMPLVEHLHALAGTSSAGRRSALACWASRAGDHGGSARVAVVAGDALCRGGNGSSS